ncbi:MAG: GatB/YqeY domain-containing protein [Lachnospiraceae bacterium]|nr:GatB/YqeY domain-containing protein [Lachnospiraceae bacterium]
MSKIEFIRGEMMAAMKAKDKQRKAVLSSLLTALKNVQIDKRADLTEEEENQVILKLIKQTKETLEMTPADRTDIIDECNYNISVLEEYAPKMMDESEISEVIDDVLKELGIDKATPQDKGKIMKTLMPKVKGKADGKLVNEVLGKKMA